MNRFFGSSGPKPPKATLDSAITTADSRVAGLDVKIASVNAELGSYQTKLAKMREGPGKNAIKQKALRLLQRRRQYEHQKEQLESQMWNMEQTQTMQDTLKNTMAQVDAMKTTHKELQRQHGKIDIDKIEKMQDDMAELTHLTEETQEILSSTYQIPDDVGEDELDAELEALAADTDFGMGELEGGIGSDASGLPSFMQDEVPEFIDEPAKGQADKQVKEAAG